MVPRIFDDNTYCRFQIEWYGLDVLFTHDDYNCGVADVWYRIANLYKFCDTNIYPFMITNVCFNSTMPTMPLDRQVDLDKRLSQKWKDSRNDTYIPLLAIDLESNQYILLSPYVLVAFPAFFEGWLIIPTNFYSTFAAIHEYQSLKQELSIDRIGEVLIKNFVIDHLEEIPDERLTTLRQSYTIDDYNNLDSKMASPYISEIITLRRNLFRFINHYCNPKHKNPIITGPLNLTKVYTSQGYNQEVELFFELWQPLISQFQLFEEIAGDPQFLKQLNQSMRSNLKLEFLF
jgi:hypothetical protein